MIGFRRSDAPASVSYRPSALVAAVVVIGIAVSVVGGVATSRAERTSARGSLARDAKVVGGGVIDQIRQLRELVDQAPQFFDASKPLTTERFQEYVDTTRFMNGFSAFLAFLAIEQVHNPDGTLDAPRIQRIWPQTNLIPPGLDISVIPEARITGSLQRTLGDTDTSASVPIDLAQFGTQFGSRPAVAFLRRVEQPPPVANLWLAIAVRPQSVAAVASLPADRRVGLTIDDVTDATPMRIATIPDQPDLEFQRDLTVTNHVDVSGRNWRISVGALDGYRPSGSSGASPMTVAFLGLMVTLLLAALAWAVGVAVQRRTHSSTLSHAATHDALTGLPNRSLVIDRVGQALLRARRSGVPVAVLFVDIDGFKALNDVYGHEVGDRALIEISDRLQAALRESDTVGRIGGDEFIVIAEDTTTREGAADVADRIINVLSIPIVLAEVRAQVGASVGITMAAGDETAEEVLRAADSAMYEAKQNGRSRYHVYDDRLRTRDEHRVRLERDLETAVERGELELHFQPIFDTKTLACGALEALIRWRHPQLGILMPDEFLPLARRRGLLVGIDRWVFSEVCQHTREWTGLTGYRRLWCNVSPAWFARDKFLEELDEIARDCGADPTRIALEFDEDVLDGDLRRTARVLSDARALGYAVVIDDFGAGASSIATLRDLELDALKLDRSLVAPIGTSEDADTIAGAMCALGRGLRLVVVAEGVERADQLAALRRFGCEYVQGFLLSAAVPTDVAGDWTVENRPLGSPHGPAPDANVI